MAVIRTAVLHDAAVEAGNGAINDVEAFIDTTVYISGTSTSRSITFEGSVDEVNFVEIQGVNSTNLAVASTTSGTDEIWNFNVSGLRAFRVVLNSVAGGNVTIVANNIA